MCLRQKLSRPTGLVEWGARCERRAGSGRPSHCRLRSRSGIYRTVPGHTMGAVVALLAVIFVVVPIVELFVIIQVGQAIGALNTIALLLIVGFVGAWLAKREGTAVWLRFRRQIEAGAVPGREIVDGVLILFAGALMLTPGFVTDILALLLLLPPVRAVVRATLLKRYVGRIIEVRGADGRRLTGR